MTNTINPVKRLNLGCGDKPKQGWINIDSRPGEGVDVVRDILRGLPFDDVSVDEVFSENFMEHLPQGEVIWVMNEIWRVLKYDGRANHHIPMAGTTNFWQDPTHTAHWIPETLTYFTWGHPRNAYYREPDGRRTIRSWCMLSCDLIPPNNMVMDVHLMKSGAIEEQFKKYR